MVRTLLVLIAVVMTSTSCSKNSEQNDLSQAQACLDNVPEGDYDAANACLPMVKDYTSQQAEILRCSIILTSGGLMEDKIVTAYNALKDDTQTNKTAAYMAALALSNPSDVTQAYAKATEADQYCQMTGIAGYQYLSGLVVAGSFMNYVTGSAIDITNPAAAQNAINTLIANCVTTPSATCTNNIGTLGSTAENLANSYCTGSNADSSVCDQVNGAISASGGSSSAAGAALLCYLNNKTYSTSDGQCH